MNTQRIPLTLLTAVCWGVGAYFMQSAVGDHLSFALAAVLAGLIALIVMFLPFQMTMLLSAYAFSPIFAMVAVVLAWITWDWRGLVAAIAFGVACVLSIVVVNMDHEATGGRTAAEPTVSPAESSTGPGGARRLVAAYRRRRPSSASDGD